MTRVFSLKGVVAAVGVVALIIGFIVGSMPMWIVCGLIAAAVAAFLVAAWRTERATLSDAESALDDGRHVPLPRGHLKKLLFDDFQPPEEKYTVKEVEEEKKVVPSTKTAEPAPIHLKEEVLHELEILDFFDLDADAPYTDVEPKSEFHSLLNKVLLVLKDVLFAHTVAFFWANREKQQMVVESMATECPTFMGGKRFSIENDLISQVAMTGRPQLVGRVNPLAEKELLRYYESPANVKSALGVPVFFKSSGKDILPVGVIVADSKAEDAFGAETLLLLGRFTKLVSALVKSYTDKYDLLLDSELLSSIRRLQDRIRSDANERALLDALADEVNRLANWDYLTVTLYADDRRGWVLHKVVNKTGQPYVAPDQLVDVPGSLVGEVIKSNKVEMVPDLSVEMPARFHDAEDKDSSGSFLCVPISSFNRCYGALTLESRNKSNFSGSEVETIYRLVENAAGSLEVLYMNDLVREDVVVDRNTGLMTRKHFTKKLEEEVRRAEDYGTELAFVSIAVDAMQEHCTRYGNDASDTILNEIARIVRTNMRLYDVLGRQDADTLGILLVSTAACDAYLWAEKMRKIIAGHVLMVAGRSFSVTVSAGVCGLTEGMRAEELVAGTSQVLEKAVEGGGNLVRVF